MENNITKDVSVLSTISEKTLSKLINIYIYAINEAIEESMLEHKNKSELDIGLGTLIILHEDNELKFKFIPSAKLKESIINTVVNKQNTLDIVLENTLINRITNRYKDLI